MSSIRSNEANIFKESTPVPDTDYKCVVELCIDNYDLSTWGIDGEEESDDDMSDYELEQEKETDHEDDYEPDDEEESDSEDSADDDEETDGEDETDNEQQPDCGCGKGVNFENYEITDI